jgi:hypothetical protein
MGFLGPMILGSILGRSSSKKGTSFKSKSMSSMIDKTFGREEQLREMLMNTPGIAEALEASLGLVQEGRDMQTQAGYAQAGAVRSSLAQNRADMWRTGLLNARPGAGYDNYLRAQEVGSRAQLGMRQMGAETVKAGLTNLQGVSGQLNPMPGLMGILGAQVQYESAKLSAASSRYAARKSSQSDIFSAAIKGFGGASGLGLGT